MHFIVKDLTLFRNNVILFKALNFNLKSGDILYITGANGIGKSTFLRSIAGYYKQYKGSINFTLKDKILSPRLHCSYLSTTPNLSDMLTIVENLNFWQNLTKQSFQNSDNFFQLPNYLFKNFSAGQKKQASIMQFLAMNRPLWLLDEPFLHLDKATQKILYKLLEEHSKKGGISIITSHNNITNTAINLNDFI